MDVRPIEPPDTIDASYRCVVDTPDEDMNEGARLAIRALWEGATTKGGRLVPTVCGSRAAYPQWVHPYDNYWIDQSVAPSTPHRTDPKAIVGVA